MAHRFNSDVLPGCILPAFARSRKATVWNLALWTAPIRFA
jgi:hypothetical protein